MSDKTVKIEYQFTGEDVGLTDKIEDIYKKLDKLGDGASVTIKKLDGLNNETITLTNNLNTSSGKVDVFSSELKQMQKEIEQATADVERLNNALLQQQKLMNSTNGSGMIASQKTLNSLTQETTNKLQEVAQLQKRISAKGIDFKGTPKFKALEKNLTNTVKQLQIANNLSNQLSTNGSNKQIRKINNPTIRETSINSSKIKNRRAGVKASNKKNTTATVEDDKFNFNKRVNLRRLAEKYPDSAFDEMYKKHKAQSDKVDVAKRFYESEESIKKGLDLYTDEEFFKETKKTKAQYLADELKRNIPYETGKAELEALEKQIATTMSAMDYKKYLGENAPEKVETISKSIKKETKAIEQNTIAKERNRRLSNRKNADNKQQEVPFINIDKEREAFLKRNENRTLKNLVHQVNNGEIKNSDFDNIMKSELERSNTELKDTLTSLKAHGQSENHPDIADMMKDMRMENTLLKELDKAYEKHLDTINKVNTVKKDSFDLDKQRIKEIAQKTGMSERQISDIGNALDELRIDSRMDKLLLEEINKDNNSINGYTIQKAPFSEKAIKQETKAITENTKAKTENRKITNATIRKAPFAKQLTSDMKKIKEEFNNGKLLNTSTDFKGTDLEVSGKTIASMYRSTNKEVKKLLSTYSELSKERDAIAKNLPKTDNKLSTKLNQLKQYNNKMKALENVSNGDREYKVLGDDSITEKTGSYAKLKKNIEKVTDEIAKLEKKSTNANDNMVSSTDEYINKAVEAQKVLKDIDNILNKPKTNTAKVVEKAIPEEKTAKKYRKAVQTQSTQSIEVPSNIVEEAKQVENIASQINSKAMQLKDAIKNDDTAIVSQLQGEIKTLMAQRQALEKMQGKTLKNTAGKSYGTKIEAPVQEVKEVSTRNIDSQTQAQNKLNMSKEETLRLEKEIADTNAKTAKQQARNIQAQTKADENRHQLVLANTKAYEESKERQQESSRKHANQKRQDSAKFKQAQANKKYLQDLPNNLKNITNAYKKANAMIDDENVKLKQINETISNLASKGVLKSSDFTKIEKQLSSQQKRMANASASVDKANQKAVKALTVANDRLNKLQNLKNGDQTYRVKAGQTISGKTGSLKTYSQIKQNASELREEMAKLDTSMMSYSKNAMGTNASLLRMQNGLSSLSNITGLAGKGILNLGNSIDKLGRGMMNTGQNIQRVANSMRGLQIASGAVLGGALNESLDFNKSLMGVASTLNRIDPKTLTVMSDVEFDANIDAISNKAKELAKTSIYDANHIMEGFRYTALAGWDTQEMLETLPVFTNLATVARLEGEQFVNVVDLVTDSLASLGMAYEGIDYDGDGVFDEKIRKDAESLANEAQRLSDVMIKAQSISNMDVNQLAEGYKIAGSQLSNYGLSLEEITSMFAVLANRGIKGAKAATGLSSIMANLTGKTGQASKALDEITEKTGIDVSAFDKNGEYIGIEKHLDRLSSAFKKLKEMYGSEYGVDNLQLAQLLGGKHHFKSLTKLLEGYQTGEYNDTLNLLKNSAGSTAEMAETVNESSWAKLKIAISQVKGMLLELGDAMMPVVEKVVAGIGKITDAFTKLGDDQKLGIVKLLGALMVLPAVLTILSNGFTVFGGIIRVIGGLFTGLGKGLLGLVKAFGTIKTFIGALTSGSGFIGALTTAIPALSGIISLVSSLAPFILACVVAFIAFKDEIMSIGTAFKTAMSEADGFFDFIIKWIQNIGYEINHSLVKAFNEGLGKGGIADFFMGMVEGLLKVIKLIPGVGKKADEMLTNLQKRKEEGFLSLADMKAQENGYATYEEYKEGKKQAKKQEIVTNVTTKLNDLSGGKFGKLIETFSDKNETQQLTFEAVVETAKDYNELLKGIDSKEAKKLEIETEIKVNEDKLLNTNKKIISIQDEIKELEFNPEINADKIASLKAELETLTKDRDKLVGLKVNYEDQLAQIDADLTKDRQAKLIIEETIQESGKEEEFNYQQRKDKFKQDFNMDLVIENTSDIEKTKELIRKIPGVEKALRAQLEVETDPTKYNEIVMALEELEQDKKTAKVMLEVQKNQNTMEEKQKLIEELEAENIEIDANINFLTKNGSIKDTDLPEEVKQAVTNYRLKKGSNERYLESYNKEIQEAKENTTNAISEGIKNGVSEADISNLWDRLYENKDNSFMSAMKDYAKKTTDFYFRDAKDGSLGKMLGLDVNKGQRVEKEKVNKTQSNVISFGDKVDTKPVDYSSSNSGIEQNTASLNANTSAVKENQQAVQEQQETLSNTPEIDTTGIESYSEAVKTTTEETKQGLEETKSTLEDLITPETMVAHLEAIGTNVDGLSEKINAMKEVLSEISFEVLNESMNTIFETLNSVGEKVMEIQTTLLNLGSEGLSGIADELLAGIENARLALITLPASLDLSSFNIIGETLRTSIEGARTALMNICGVARNSGITAMNSMGQALQTSLGNARTALLSVCNVAANRGIGTFSAMGNALVSAIDTAIGKVETIAGKISTIKEQIGSIKMPSIQMPNLGAPASVASIPSIANSPMTASAFRSISNSSMSSSIANTSNFNFNMNGIAMQDRRDARNTAKILTTHLKRRGF